VTDIFFIADFFVDEIVGGGELNNHELIGILTQMGYPITLVKSNQCTLNLLKENLDSHFIVANFIALSEECKFFLQEKCSYIIYEHDHKYLSTRDPSVFPDYKAPQEAVINYSFYENAKGVFCQSKMHKDVVIKNLGLSNIISVGGNLWSLETLNKIREYSKKQKREKYSIWNSYNPIKCTALARAFCFKNKYEEDLIGPLPYNDFLSRLTDNKYFVFFPQTLETLGRVVVESRMAGMTVISNNKVSAISEEWFKLKGEPLIDVMIEKRESIPKKVVEVLFS
jgi:hypothetical protein